MLRFGAPALLTGSADGEAGVLRYRGYDIEDLAKNASFLEVAFLLLYGELPNKDELDDWCVAPHAPLAPPLLAEIRPPATSLTQKARRNTKIMRHTFLHENLTQLMRTFRYDAHPMGMVRRRPDLLSASSSPFAHSDSPHRSLHRLAHSARFIRKPMRRCRAPTSTTTARW